MHTARRRADDTAWDAQEKTTRRAGDGKGATGQRTRLWLTAWSAHFFSLSLLLPAAHSTPLHFTPSARRIRPTLRSHEWQQQGCAPPGGWLLHRHLAFTAAASAARIRTAAATAATRPTCTRPRRQCRRVEVHAQARLAFTHRRIVLLGCNRRSRRRSQHTRCSHARAARQAIARGRRRSATAGMGRQQDHSYCMDAAHTSRETKTEGAGERTARCCAGGGVLLLRGCCSARRSPQSSFPSILSSSQSIRAASTVASAATASCHAPLQHRQSTRPSFAHHTFHSHHTTAESECAGRRRSCSGCRSTNSRTRITTTSCWKRAAAADSHAAIRRIATAAATSSAPTATAAAAPTAASSDGCGHFLPFAHSIRRC